MAFENFVRPLRNLDNMAVIDAGDAHPYERRDRQADFCGIDLGAVAGDDVCVFELVNALDNGRRRQPDAAAEFRVADAGVFL